jgi:hypothetical protein
MTIPKESWKIKFEFLIERLGKLIAKEGRKMVGMNVKASPDVKKQFEKYQSTCEQVKNQPNVIVMTSLPGEERIFWPYHDVQFYIRYGDEKIHATGNPKMIQAVFNVSDEPVSSDIPDMDFWTFDNFHFQVDTFQYVDETRLFDDDFELNLTELVEKYHYQHTKEFENKEYWYLLKFLFISSYLQNLDGYGELIGGVPKGLKIKCECGELNEVRWYLKGIFKIPEYNHRHDYYLNISHQCEECGIISCVYRSKSQENKGIFPPIRVFMNFLDPKWNYSIEDVNMLAGWLDIFKRAASQDLERVQQLFSKEIIKMGTFLKENESKLKK